MLRQSMKSLICCGVALAVIAVGLASSTCLAGTIIGEPVLLSTLTANAQAEVVVGDKKFTQFGYTATGDMPGAAGVNVVPIVDDDGNFGIRFQGFFTDLASTMGGSDALITYKVEVTDPQRFISDAHLAGNTTLPSPERRGVVNVTETFLPLGGSGEYTMTIYDDEQIATPKLIDWVDFIPPVKMLTVQKDIGIFGVAGFPAPSLSFVDQTFSQIIPEPATVTMMALGLVALAGWAQRRGSHNRR